MEARDPNEEVQKVFEMKQDLCPDIGEKPLSPVLNNRKILHNRRRTRCKLLGKFEKEVKKQDVPKEIFTEDSFTLSQTDSLLETLDRLEEIERNRDKIHKLICSKKTDNFCFKKPMSPATNKVKRTKCVQSNEESVNLELPKADSSEILQENVAITNNTLADIPKDVDFTTGNGKTIVLNKDVIKESSNIFSDILNPSDKCRGRKFNTLRRNCEDSCNKTVSMCKNSSNDALLECGASEPFEDTILEKLPGKNEGKIKNIEALKKIFEENAFEESKSEETKNILSNQINGDVGFQKASGKSIQLSKTAILKAKSMFGDDLLEENVKLPTNFDMESNIELKLNNEQESNFIKTRLDENSFEFQGASKKIESNFDGNMLYKATDNDPSLKSNTIYKLSHKNDPIGCTKKVDRKNCLNSGAENIAKSVFEGENFDDLFSHRSNNFGFKAASSSETTFKNSNFADTRRGFTLTGNKSFNTAKNIFEGENFNDLFSNSSKDSGFQTPTILNSKSNRQNNDMLPRSNKNFTLTGKPLNTAKNIFEGENFDDIFQKASTSKNVGFEIPKVFSMRNTGPSKNTFKPPINKFDAAKNIFGNENFDDLFASSTTFQSAKMISKTEYCQFPSSSNRIVSELGFTREETNTAQRKSENVQECLFYFTQILEFIRDNKIPSKPLKRPSLDHGNQPPNKKIKLMESTSFDSPSIPKNNLTRRSLFSSPNASSSPDDGYKLNARRSVKKRLGVPSLYRTIPVLETNLESAKSFFERELKPVVNESSHTPVRDNCFIPKYNSTPLGNFVRKEQVTITPIRNNESLMDESKGQFEDTIVPQKFCLKVSKNKNLDELIGEFDNERKILEEQLKSVMERLKLLKKNKKIIDDSNRENIRQTEGVLYIKKKHQNKIQIKDFVCQNPGESSKTGDPLFKITPQNADHFHFNLQECMTSVKTQDGAEVIPNLNKQIGLSEISNAFKTMPGIDTKLIPNGWIKNHYKWIIWKLASYERMFSNKFEDCLSVENVIQQLKYRYDREIDKAERPVLRKIFEKDIASQRRIVLCISNIVKNNGNYELELTDGWYSIRTVIDEPLNQQIMRRKIKIGTKLIVYGAELLNCDGCYPLEATDLVCLKIDYNSTRRARWHSKLGYQKDCGPFPIQIESIHPVGGVISRIDVYIARIYPTKFMEKRNGNITIWRNQKAEDNAANEFENSLMKKYDDIQEKMQDCFGENSEQNKFEIYAKLTEKMQEEIPTKLPSVPLNKITVVDVLSNSEKYYTLTLWRQNENFIFKEGEILTIINVLPSKKGELCANSSTKYIRKPKDLSKVEKYQRRVTAIALVLQLNFKPVFGEIDTIGFVVQVNVSSTQEIWMADHKKRLLLIKIYETPETIALPDYKIKEVKSVSNLILKKSGPNYGVAMANHWTVFSKYPAQKHLREAMEEFVKEMPEDIDEFWKECKENIDKVKSNETSKSSITFSEDDINCSQITETDRVLSLIDFDKFT